MLQKFRNKIEKYKDFIYILPLVTFIIITIFSTKTNILTNFDKEMSLVRYVCVFIVVFKILLFDIREYSKRTYINIFILSIITCIISIKSDSRLLIQYLILIIGAYRIKFDKIVKYVLIGESFTILIIIILGIIGIFPNYAFGRNNQDVVRYSLGFEFTSYPAIFIYYITMLYLYYRKEKTKIIEYVILVAINVIIYKLTNTRMEIICSMSIILITLIHNKFKTLWFQKLLKFSAKYLMIFLVIFSILFACIYTPSNPIMAMFNKALSGRLNLAEKGMNTFGITLFGNKIEWVTTTKIENGEYDSKQLNYVDNGYLNIMYNYGIIMLVLIIYGFYKIAKKENDTYLCCFIIILAIHSFVTPQLLQIVYNIFILLFVELIITPASPKENEDDENITQKKMTLEEIHSEEIKMLKSIIDYFEKNKINYFICGGTLLGAIRHKGFIPWDDDIDILMPRTDYNKFLELSKTNNLMIAENLEVHASELKNLNDPFCKIMNLNTIMDKHYIEDEYDKHLWIDIFPMDGLPEDSNETEKIYKKVLFLRRILVMLKAKDEIIKHESKTKLKAITKPILRVLLKPIGVTGIVKMINKTCTKYNYDTSKYVGGIAWGYGPQEKLLKEKVQNQKVIFENIEVNTFSCYDEYLRNLYGNYMELPPKEKQVAHVMNVRKIEDGE